MSTIRELLCQQPLTSGLNDKYLDFIADCSHEVEFKAGKVVFEEGAPANHFYLLTGGRVALETAIPQKDPKVIQNLQAGDLLGWSWLVEPYCWFYDIRAAENTPAIEVNALCIRGKIYEDHEFGFQLLSRIISVMANRMSQTRLRLLDIYSQPRG